MSYYVEILKNGEKFKEFKASKIDILSRKIILNSDNKEVPEGDIISLSFTKENDIQESFDIFSYSIFVYDFQMFPVYKLEQVM